MKLFKNTWNAKVRVVHVHIMNWTWRELDLTLWHILLFPEYDGGDNNYYYYENGNQYQNNNGGEQQRPYSGPYCASDGYSIHIGMFSDEGCTNQLQNSPYSNYVPYAKKSLIQQGECLSCTKVDRDQQQNNNNQYQNNNYYQQNQEREVTELCEQSYENAVKCETNMQSYYKDTSGCDYINNVLPRLSGSSSSSAYETASDKVNEWVSGKKNSEYQGVLKDVGGPIGMIALVLGVLTIFFCLYSCCLYNQLLGRPRLVDPSNQDSNDAEYLAPKGRVFT